jgi:hypothetical protein
MGITRTFLARTGLVLCGAILASSGRFAQARDFHSILKSFRPKAELAMTILENASQQTAKLTITDSYTTIGHALIVDADSGRLIQDMASPKDVFSLPPKTKVGIYFIPTLQVIAIKFSLQVGDNPPHEFRLSRQKAVKFKGAVSFDPVKESSKVTFNKEFFENGDQGACWTCID